MTLKRFRWQDAAPSISPAFHANWLDTDTAVRRSEGTGSAAGLSTGENLTVNPTPTLACQVITAPLFAGEVKGPFRIAVACANAQGTPMELRVIARVLSPNGSVVRGTLVNQANGVEAAASSNSRTQIMSVPTPTPVVAQAGDVLCVEYGMNMKNTTSVSRSAVWTGWGASATDQPFTQDNVNTSSQKAWFEFDVPDEQPVKIALGSALITDLRLGSSAVDAAYLGSNRVL